MAIEVLKVLSKPQIIVSTDHNYEMIIIDHWWLLNFQKILLLLFSSAVARKRRNLPHLPIDSLTVNIAGRDRPFNGFAKYTGEKCSHFSSYPKPSDAVTSSPLTCRPV